MVFSHSWPARNVPPPARYMVRNPPYPVPPRPVLISRVLFNRSLSGSLFWMEILALSLKYLWRIWKGYCLFDLKLYLQMQNNRDEGVDLRLLVHQSQAGCIIGRGGYKIKELREQSGLQTLKVYQMLCPGSTDRVIQLVGDLDKVVDCLQAIAELLEGAPPKGSRQNYDARDADESIAADYGGWGVGNQNAALGLVQRRNNLSTAAYGQSDRPIPNSKQLNGLDTDSLLGMYVVPTQPPRLDCPRLGSGNLANNVLAAGLFGGGGTGVTVAGRTGGQAAAVTQALASSLPHASAAAMLAATGGQTAGGPNAGPAGDAAAAAAMMAAGLMILPNRVAMNFLTPTTTTQVSVSNKMIGAIMGRAGVRINQVRQESNADIKISRQEPGVEDRIITITGTPEQIQNAQFLLQMCVKKYGDQV
ncbi:hypothetical protein T265_10677 [Opisthorchis viverrini]|uniref:K Homology domain-containing protein n=1 Tax=Opisthorchis viverrini TaxID=6198 RepID=A0A074ZCE1_OPIVI|nr:hypothetical protein T265_10677 [Opisthorchis viverrini]KER20870.1 hypothetical protein T265_10677 [Opisthorchis viverrini]